MTGPPHSGATVSSGAGGELSSLRGLREQSALAVSARRLPLGDPALTGGAQALC